MSYHRVMILCTAVFAFIAAAGNTVPGKTGNTANLTGKSGFCGTILVDEVASVLGFTGLGAPKETIVSSQTTCMYPLGGNPAKVIISYNKGMDPVSFDDERKRADAQLPNSPSTEVVDLGEAAYTRTVGRTTSLFVLKGNIRIMITTTAKFDKVKQLAEQIIAKL